MGAHIISSVQLAACGFAAFFIGCTSMNEVTSSTPEEEEFTTSEFNAIAEGRGGAVKLLEQKVSSLNSTQIEASADSLFWTDAAGKNNRSSLGEVDYVEIVSRSDGFWEGAKWGAAGGLAAGTGAAAAQVSSQSADAQSMGSLAYVGYAVIGGTLGGLAGGTYGSITGHTFHCSFRPRGR